MVVLIGLIYLLQQDSTYDPDQKEKGTNGNGEENKDKLIALGDLEIEASVSEVTIMHSFPVNAEVKITNNSDYRIKMLMINVFINDELFNRYYIDEGMSKNSSIRYKIDDLTFREDQLGFNQIKFEVVPLQEFNDLKPENNFKIIPIEVYTY